MESKTERVKAVFDVSEKYLGRKGFDIRIRVETVQEFVRDLKFDRVLDIGCGSGAISLPLLPKCRSLTLVDLSENMLNFAKRQIPAERKNDVTTMLGDFSRMPLEPASFDLVLCIGVLAHVDSPAETIDKITQLAKPGSWVILEFTDSFHFLGILGIVYGNLLKVIRPAPYQLNRLKRNQILEWCRNSGLSLLAVYRYGLPPRAIQYFANQDQMYRMTRNLFGPVGRNRNRWLGNEFLFCFQKS